MDTFYATIQVVIFCSLIYGAIKLVERSSINEARRRDAEAWSYLTWETEKLIELQNKFIELVASGKPKHDYFRSIEAIKLAMEMRERFGIRGAGRKTQNSLF